jgi:O-antigen/teichoic acid export membrane protein
MYIISAYRLLPQLAFRPLAWDRPMFRRIFSFGWRIQFSRIAGTIASQTDKVLITYFLAIGLVTYYQLGSSIVSYAVAVPALLVSALVPAFSEIEARGERRRLIESYLRSTKYLAFFTMPLFVFIAVCAHRIMFIWMGLGYAQAAAVIQILVAAYAINVLARVSGALCMAIEKPQYLMDASLIMIAANIPLSILFIRVFGFLGVAWGTMAAINAGTVYFLGKLHKKLALPAGAYIRVTVPFFVSSMIAAGVVYAGDMIVRTALPHMGRAGNLVVFAAAGAVFSLVYLGAVHYAGLFDANDSGFLKEKFPLAHRLLFRFIKNYGP